MTLTGKDAANFMAGVHQRVKAEQAEQLANAKADAERRGKEPFDLATLETMCDTTSDGRVDPVEERQRVFEWRYYVVYPNIGTLVEFARKMEELGRG